MTKKTLIYAVALLLTVAICLPATAQDLDKKKKRKKKKADVGLAIDSKVKDFSLKNQTAQPQQLSELLKKGPVAVVFTRSVDW